MGYAASLGVSYYRGGVFGDVVMECSAMELSARHYECVGLTKMVVVAVRNNNSIDMRQSCDVTSWRRVAFGAYLFERRAAVLKNGVKEHAKSRGKLDIVTSVAEPGRPQLVGSGSGGQKGGLHNLDLGPGWLWPGGKTE